MGSLLIGVKIFANCLRLWNNNQELIWAYALKFKGFAMHPGDFNEESEKPEFIYRRSQVDKNTFLILQYQDDKGVYEPVGDYVLLETAEDPDLTEKKVMNVLTLFNQKNKNKLLDLRNLTDTRLMFYPIPDSPEADAHKLIFRTYDGTGVSTDNAVITIKKGVIDDKSINGDTSADATTS